jgi:CubicO group peptidase (beta-lactamase class C family)
MRLLPITAALAIPAILFAQPAKLSTDKIRDIEQTISTEMARSTVPGVSLAIASATGLNWAGGYGMADLENLVPVTW